MSNNLIPVKSTPLSLLILYLFVATHANNIRKLEDHTTLIFQHCSTQKLNDPDGEYTHGRKILLQKLVSQSSKSKFNTTFVMVGDRFAASLSGLFQCRKDFDARKCNECMYAIQNKSNGLCDDSMAARIQLSGCHVQYEADVYDISSPEDQPKYIHKSCGEAQGVVSIANFEQMRSQAFEALETGVMDEANFGFYSITQQGIHAVAQCVEGLGVCDCGECVVDAVHIIEEECDQSSISAQVFMKSCFLSYEFNPHDHGIHDGGGGSYPENKHGGGNSGKIVALAVGAIASLASVFMLFRFLKRKSDD